MKNASSRITWPPKLLSVAAVAFSVCGFVGTIHAADQPALAQSSPPAFDGGKSTWHDDFVRYDFLMDKETFEIEWKTLEAALKKLEQRLEKQRFIVLDDLTFADVQAACEIE